MKYRQAHLSDSAMVRELLQSYGLPSSDCEAHLKNFVVAEKNNTIIGVGGFESCGNLGLLRSFAVKHSYKNQGIAEEIFSLVKATAIVSGINQFYLLTTTASKYFERLGFSVHDRDNTPSAISTTKQFSELCPSTAVVMALDLCK